MWKKTKKQTKKRNQKYKFDLKEQTEKINKKIFRHINTYVESEVSIRRNLDTKKDSEHRIIDDRMENSLKGRRIGYNLR